MAAVGAGELVDDHTFDAVESIGVFDEEGCERPFGGLVRHGKVCVVFIRHFACSFCQDYLVALKNHFPAQKLGDRKLIVIGNGHWSVIKSYRELVDYPLPIYSENTRTLFEGLGMICNLDRGDAQNGKYITRSIPGALFQGLATAFKMGFKASLQSGKLTQLGGEFIFVDGKNILAHRMQNTRDHIEPQDLAKSFLSA